jgi:hypothetical protein
MSKGKKPGVVLAACLMAAAASNSFAHQMGSIGSNNSEFSSPFAFVVSLYWLAVGPKGPVPPPA